MRDWRLWGILVVALAARAALLRSAFAVNNSYLARPHPEQPVAGSFTADSGAYWVLAWALREGHFAYGVPEVFRTPGYSAFIAAIIVAMQRGLSDPSAAPVLTEAVISAQMLIDLHLVFLTYLLGRWVLSHRVGLMAAFFQATSPLAVAAPCRFLSDSLFAFLLTAAVLLFVRHAKTSGWWSLLASAAVLGIACYVRPIGLPMAGIFALALLVERARLLRRAANAAAFAAILAVLIAPWVARNIAVADFYGFSSVQAEGMYFYDAAETLAVKEGRSVDEVRDELRQSASFFPKPSGLFRTQGARVRLMQRRAWEIFRENPGTFLWVHLRGTVAFWLPGATEVLEIAGATSGQKGTLEVLHRQGLAAAARHYFGGEAGAMWAAVGMSGITLLRYAGLVLLGVSWLRGRLRRKSAAGDPQSAILSSPASLLILFVGLIVVSWLLPGPAAHPRFRVPVEPLLSIAAAAGWLGSFGRKQIGCRVTGTVQTSVTFRPRGD